MPYPTASSMILSKGYPGYWFEVRPDLNQLRATVYETAALSSKAIIPLDSVANEMWHQIGLIRRSGSVEAWVDGSLIDTVTDHTGNIDSTRDLEFGRRVWTSDWYFEGLIGITRIYERALQPWEVQALYNYDKALMGI